MDTLNFFIQFSSVLFIKRQITRLFRDKVQFIVIQISPIHTLKLLFHPIPRPERARADCGEKKLPFNRKKTPSEPEPEPGRAAICLDQLGVERTGKRGQQAP